MILEYSISTFMTAGLFIALGIFICRFWHLQDRNKESIRTPYNFNWMFWIKDNWHTITANFIINLLIIYMFPHFEIWLSNLATQYVTFAVPTNLWFFSIGVCNDLLLALIKRLFINLRKIIPQ